MKFNEQELDETIQPIKQTDLIYGIEDRPPFKDALFAAVQHLLAIFVARYYASTDYCECVET